MAAMLDKPDIADQAIIDALRSAYGIAPARLEFLPLGNDQFAFAYRVFADSGDYFLKLRRGETRHAALVAPHELNRLGIDAPVAPMPTLGGRLLAEGAHFDLILYPYIDGPSAWGMSLASAEARQWGEIMRRIHSAPLTDGLIKAVPREVFGVKWLDTMDQVERVISAGAYQGELAGSMAYCWRAHKQEIECCRARFAALGAKMTQQQPPFTLCHADIHTANIIIDSEQRIRIVDWDEAVIAPKERDLMFFLLDGHEREFEQAFFAGYGSCEINWLALAYYKYDWVAQELADYGARVFLARDLGAADLQASLREFQRLFQPGDVIERAHQAYGAWQAASQSAD